MERKVNLLWDAIILQYLEKDTSISEIETNGDLSVFVRQNGKRKEIKNVFQSVEEYRESIKYLIERVNKFAPENPRFLEEGTLFLNTGGLGRCHIVLPPASIEPLVTIARKTEDLTTLEDITYSGSMSTMMMNAIKAFVDCDQTIVLSGSTGAGKNLHKDTLIPTRWGFKKIKDIKKGDFVYDLNGSFTKVTNKYSPKEENFYRIEFNSGEKIKAGGNHLWRVEETLKTVKSIKLTRNIKETLLKEIDKEESDLSIDEIGEITKQNTEDLRKLIVGFEKENRKYNKKEVLDYILKSCDKDEVTFTKIVDTNDLYINSYKYRIPYVSKEVEYREKDLAIDPYTLGVYISTGFKNIREEIYNHIDSKYDCARLNTEDFVIPEIMNELSLVSRKSIPDAYKVSSVKQREELLAGIVDSLVDFDYKTGYGKIKKEIDNNLKKDISELCSSLGIESDDRANVFTLIIDRKLPVKIKSKDIFVDNRYKYHTISKVEKIEGFFKDYYCLAVDSPTHTFLSTEKYIPTHNTTMLEAVTKLWDPKLRIGVVEDAPELRLIQPNVVYLKSALAKPGQNPLETADLSWCVSQLNRMRVDKMIIGETRGKEFASFLTAANSGNEGSLTTIHANDPRGCLEKMNQFVNEASSSPQRVINKNIANTIDIIIQLDKKNGNYRTTAIEFVSNQLGNDESATIATQPLFTYDKDNDEWIMGKLPDSFREILVAKGYDPQTFSKKADSQGQGRRPLLGGF